MKISELLFGQEKIESTASNIALLLLRLSAGFTIMYAGLDKLPLPDWMINQVIEIGFPFPTFFAWMAVFSEFAFGLLLCFGLLTRISGLMLAFTLGVAAFGFHKVLPIVDMHITQYFFWIFILFTFVGGGKFSIDFFVSKSDSFLSKYKMIFASLSFSILLAFGLFREITTEQRVPEEFKINSISIAGSFNDWDPTASLMVKNENLFQIDLEFNTAQLIEFKFTANNSWDYNLGEENQSSKGFPIKGIAELDKGNSTNNIKVYIPVEGKYKIEVDINNFEYSVEKIENEK